MKKNWIAIFIIVVVALALVFVATQTKKQAKEINIGAIIPLTGSFASYGEPVRDGMLLALEEINNTGGIEGIKIKMIIEDDAGDPKTSVNAFAKLANTDRVPLVLGPLSSGCSMATAPIAEKTKVVQISTLAGIPDLSKAGDYIFRIYPSSELGARYVAKQAASRFKPKKVAILYANNPFGETSRRIYEETVKKLGIEVVSVESFSDGDQDFRTQLTKIKKTNPDLLLCSTYWVEGARILVQMVELGLNIPVLGEDGWRGPIADIVGERGLKLLYFADIAFGSEVEDNRTMKEFIRNFESRYHKKANTYAAVGYDAVYIAKKAIEEGGDKSELIKDTLYKIDYLGALGKIKFDTNGDNIGVKFALFQLNLNNEAVLIK